MTSEDVWIPTADAVPTGIPLIPDGDDTSVALLLISGSGAHDRDESVWGHALVRVNAEYATSHGVLVLHSDDRGVGASSGDAKRQDFEGSVADAIAAARWLATRTLTDQTRVVLVGHRGSEARGDLVRSLRP